MMPRCGVVVALALVACGGRAMTDGVDAQGGQSSGGSSSVAGASGGGGSAQCLNSGVVPPPSPMLFLFESAQSLWLRTPCHMEYALTKVCDQTSVAIQEDSACAECDGCFNPPVLLGPRTADGTTASMAWLGDMYVPDTTGTACSCKVTQARSGTYTVGINGFLTADDALANKNGYPSSFTFEYPPLSGVVQVKLNFTGL